MNLILDLLFPKRCVGCGRFDTYFCQECVSNILQTDLICPVCEGLALGGQTHSACRKRFGLDGLWSLGIYRGLMQQAIKQLKYRRIKGLAEAFTDITLEYWAKYQPFVLDQIKKDYGQGWAVVPVPLYWWRENTRGFNQSSVFGQILSKRLGLGYYEALKRVRYTKPQVKLKGSDRHQNIKGAFEIANSEKLIAKSILLIDDVWTTGSTLRECCYVLKKAGAKKVWAITLAR